VNFVATPSVLPWASKLRPYDPRVALGESKFRPYGLVFAMAIVKIAGATPKPSA